MSAFTDPDIDDDGYIQVKNSLKENEDALQNAKKAYEEFDAAIEAGNPELAEFAKQGNLGAFLVCAKRQYIHRFNMFP